jgi:hypothetical protein
MTTRFFKPTGRLYACCATEQGNDMVIQVALPNGRKLDIATKKGADEFVDTFGTAFISTSLAAIADQDLELSYWLIHRVADNASPEKIASGIPESELRALIEYTRDTLDTLSADRNWLRSGTLSRRHELLVQAVVSFSKHPSFVKIFLSNEGMEAVANFYASRKKNDTPNNCVAELVIKLVRYASYVLTQEGLSKEKVFGTIEKSGLLGQCIRCVPVYPERSASIAIVECLQTCLQLVKRKLKSGTPTGDILDAVIAGKDGPINEKAKSGLVRLQSLARLSNAKDDYGNKFTAIKMCHHCKKTETQMDGVLLMKCKRCKLAYYCSKECQVADWKSHKKVCKALVSGRVSRSAAKTSNATVSAFVTSNYIDIAKEVYKKTQEYNVPAKELLLEVDFYGDAPALRNEFKVWLTSGFLEGSSVADAPDWFRTLAEKTLARDLREVYEEVPSNDLLAVDRAGNCMVAVSRLNCPGTETSYPFFSDEVVESIGSEDYDRMVAYLGQHLTDEYFREKRNGST